MHKFRPNLTELFQTHLSISIREPFSIHQCFWIQRWLIRTWPSYHVCLFLSAALLRFSRVVRIELTRHVIDLSCGLPVIFLLNLACVHPSSKACLHLVSQCFLFLIHYMTLLTSNDYVAMDCWRCLVCKNTNSFPSTSFLSLCMTQ